MIKVQKICFMLCFFLLFFCMFFVGCHQDVLKQCQPKISDERQNYFEGESQNYYVSFSSGIRESPYILNGKSEQKVEFGVVTIKPKNFSGDESITYNVCVNNDEYIGEFERSPYDDTYAGDINKKVDDDCVLVIKINNGSGEEMATMTNISKSFKINSQKALLIAINEVGDKFSSLKQKDFEIYIKIVADFTNKISEKYYLVMFLDVDGNSLNVIVNPTTCECEIKKL